MQNFLIQEIFVKAGIHIVYTVIYCFASTCSSFCHKVKTSTESICETKTVVTKE